MAGAGAESRGTVDGAPSAPTKTDSAGRTRRRPRGRTVLVLSALGLLVPVTARCDARGAFAHPPAAGVSAGRSRLGMALTEEFLEMKVSGDPSAAPAPDRPAGVGRPDAATPAPPPPRRSPADGVGRTALSAVQSLASLAGLRDAGTLDEPLDGPRSDPAAPPGSGGGAGRRARLIQWQRDGLRSVRREIVGATDLDARWSQVRSGPAGTTSGEDDGGGTSGRDGEDSVSTALATLERDMSMLDNLASLQPQLSVAELAALVGAVAAAGLGPVAFPGTSVSEALAPAAAAFTASITIGSEYIGRVAVADGKEIAANTIQCAAEAEVFLANAERVKAISPLCVGIAATFSLFSLLIPNLVEALSFSNSPVLITELYLLSPLVCVLSAAVGNLALEETRGFCARAINVGVRRFSKSGLVGRTWLSTSEQIQRSSRSKTDRWVSFASSVLPAPVLGSFFGGPSLSSKCIVISALAAAQNAYFLAEAEGTVARATDAVALKARSAAVCDTYANQGARNSAILPFTSALSAFCAAATAAAVELPFLDAVSRAYGTVGEVAMVSAFPILSSGFAAAAAVSKARCEVDAEAAALAASTLALEYDGMEGDGDPILKPFQAVRDLFGLAVVSGVRSFRRIFISPIRTALRAGRSTFRGLLGRRGGGGETQQPA